MLLITVLILDLIYVTRSQFPPLSSGTLAPPLPGRNTLTPPLGGQNTFAPPLPGHNTVAPPLPGQNTANPPIPGGFDPNCVDKLPNCEQFPDESCKSPYEAWAKDNCRNRCKFCNGPKPPCIDKLPDCDKYPKDSCKAPFLAWAHENCNNTCKFCQGKNACKFRQDTNKCKTGPTKPPPECKNNLTNCEAYPKESCENPKYKHWAETQCRYYCRKCSPAELAIKDAMTTTMNPALCVDKLDCKRYDKSSCCGKYRSWAKSNCPVYCGMCKGLPNTPAPCADKKPNCAQYAKDTCTNPKYRQWAEDNCMKFCNLCHQPTVSGDPCTQN